MASKANPERQISIAGKSYTLKYSARAWAALQDHFGLSSLKAVQARLADQDQFGVGDMVAVLWAGLRTHHREVSQDDVLEMIDAMGLEEAGNAVGDAFGGAAGEEEAAGTGAADPLLATLANGPSTAS